MPIHAPHAHLYNSVKLEVAKAKLGHAGRKSLYAPLNLVAYIDMMTMLVMKICVCPAMKSIMAGPPPL